MSARSATTESPADGVNLTPFRQSAPDWINARVAVIPLDGKKPMVKRPDRFGLRAAADLAQRPKFAGANLGFWCGRKNGITVVDVDAPGDDAIATAIARYGDTPLKVRTASGKAHLYFRHAGERRRIRPIKSEPIDLLGSGGIVVAPPSRIGSGDYAILEGDLGCLERLPTIRKQALAEIEEATQPVRADSDHRNADLFRGLLHYGRSCGDLDRFTSTAQSLNAQFANPLEQDELRSLIDHVWNDYILADKNWVGKESRVINTRSLIDRYAAVRDGEQAFLLLNHLRTCHPTPGAEFALAVRAMEAKRVMPLWYRRQYIRAINIMLDLGDLQLVRKGGRGPNDPSLYRLAMMVSE